MRPKTHVFPAFAGRLRKWCSFGLALLCLSSLLLTPACHRDQGKVIFALPVADWWTAAPFLLPQNAEIFKQKGLDLTTLEVKSGLESKNAVIAGTADIGVCAATPLAIAAAKKEGLVVLNTYLRASSIVGFVRPKDMAPNAVPPAPVGLVLSTISESFLYHYLKQRGQEKLLIDKQLPTRPARPADIPGLFKSQAVKSAVIWEPFLSIAGEETGYVADRSVPFEVNLYIITRPTVWNERKETVQKFLAAVEETCRYLRENSDPSRRNTEQRFGFKADFLAATWPLVHYEVVWDLQHMKDEINREAETTKALGQISEIPKSDSLFAK